MTGLPHVPLAPIPTAFDPAEIARAVSVLHPGLGHGDVVELRALDVPDRPGSWPATWSGYYDSVPALLRDASALAKKCERSGNVYVIMNPVDRALLARAANRMRALYGKRVNTTSDKEIPRRHWLLLDCDPERPAGIGATCEQAAQAVAKVDEIVRDLLAGGWPAPVRAASGNGCHALWRLDLPGDDGGLVARCLQALHAHYSDDRVKVDMTVGNASRIVTLYGTVKRKGDSTHDRPHRLARLSEVPDPVDVVPATLLEALAATAPPSPTTKTTPRSRLVGPGPAVTQGHGWLSTWIERTGIDVGESQPYMGGVRYKVRTCPSCGESDGAAVLGQLGGGGIGQLGGGIFYKCQHNRCASYKWDQFRAACEGPKTAEQPVANGAGGGAGDGAGAGLEPGVEQVERVVDAAGEDKESVATMVVHMVREKCHLFPDPSGTAHVTFDAPAGGEQTQPLRSSGFKAWAAAEHFAVAGTVATPSAIEAALGVLDGQAARCPPEPVHVRIASVDDRIYLDLCDDRRRVVEITASGWTILDRSPVRFRRRPGQLPLPEPERGGSIDELLWPLVNIPDEREWTLTKAWLLGVLRGRGPFWALLLQGEQGSAKSSAARILRNVIDPNSVPIRAAPKEDRDLLIAATASWVTCYDNLSGCPAWLSDALCRLATGSGFSARLLYTDDGEALFWCSRPLILNGIDDLATRPDLADRSLLVRLPTIPEDERLEERDLDRRVADAHPRILGSLLDAAACALRRLGDVRVARLPRMADAARWVIAGSPALGIADEGALLEILDANRADQDLVGVEADAVASAVRSLLERGSGRWTGPTRDLLRELAEVAGEQAARDRLWPKTETALGNRLKRGAPVLRRMGIEMSEFREGNQRLRALRRTDTGSGERAHRKEASA